jgi:hypothetical protein
MNVLYLLCSWFCLCFHGWVGFHGGSWLFYTHFLFFPIIRVGLFGLNSFGFAPPHLSLVQLFVSKMEVVCFLSGWLCLWIRLCAWPCRHCVWVMSDLYAGIVCTWICPCWRLVHSSFLTVTNSHSTFFSILVSNPCTNSLGSIWWVWICFWFCFIHIKVAFKPLLLWLDCLLSLF